MQHIEEHGFTKDDVETVLFDPKSKTTISNSSGEMLTFGYAHGQHICVVWEHIMDDPITMRPITAFEAPESMGRRYR
ncbi:MAG: BrnT family toxin [Planctomycetia bacterium]|nr:BrnT family toxin [Planctomycetia bacterium]